MNLTFHGGGDLPRVDEGVACNLQGWGLASRLVWRLGARDFWLGAECRSMRCLRSTSAAKARYQGDAVINTELELRYDIDGR